MIVTVLAMAGAMAAVQEPTGAASLEVHESFNVGAIQTLRLRAPTQSNTVGMIVITHADEPALIQISGDAGRLYRIQVSENGADAAGDDLRIWSTNSGDISTSHLSATDARGRDLLRISGSLASPAGSVNDRRTLAVSIQYD